MTQPRICYFKKIGENGFALAQAVTDSLALKAAASDVYSQTAVDALLSDKLEASDIAGKANTADVYSASAVDTLLSVKLVAADIAGKADSADVTAALANKLESADIAGLAVASDVYTKNAADALLADKLESADIAGKLDASVHDSRVTAENALVMALKDALYIESAPSSGVEFDYVAFE
jgi:hypothetical protein